MIDVLVRLVDSFVCFIRTGLTEFANGFISRLAALAAFLIAQLPDMPNVPAMPSEFTTALGWVAWVFPVGTVVTIFAFIVGAWIAWQVVALIFRWAKLLS